MSTHRQGRSEREFTILDREPGGGNPSSNKTFEEVLGRQLSRRALLRGALGGAFLLALGPFLPARPGRAAAPRPAPLTFQPIAAGTEDRVIVPPGYSSRVLIRWGDPLSPDLPPFQIEKQTPALQARRFGYNCDFVAYFPLPDHRSGNARRGLLAVNHEYPLPQLMFRDYVRGRPTRDQMDVQLAAVGVTIVEVRRPEGEAWGYLAGSGYNRRITGETEIEITGPAAGHPWMKTSYDPPGTRVRGTWSNCAGGKTPWGTLLTCEEHAVLAFANTDALPGADLRKAVHRRYGVPGGAGDAGAERFYPRFDVAREPNEPFRFGWVVEVDPYRPGSAPKKRTALGRFKHEGATVALARDGRVAVYLGDDEAFEYIYKFVSAGRFDPARRDANFDLLDEGTLHVASFRDDGTGEWLPLVFGRGPLTPANGFASQGHVCINTRRAADLIGATKMDRPEDIETNPVNRKVYCVLTNNTRRKPDQIDRANPRANNRHGHIIELTEDGDDPAALRFRWGIFILCGDPRNPADGAYFAGFDPGRVSPLSCPDNITFDGEGNLWIATDGQRGTFGNNDGIFAVPVDGPERGFMRQFLSGPRGAEIAGPEFTPDFTTLFCSIQHPGSGGTLDAPVSAWPDGRQPPRPGVIAIRGTGPGTGRIGA